MLLLLGDSFYQPAKIVTVAFVASLCIDLVLLQPFPSLRKHEEDIKLELLTLYCT